MKILNRNVLLISFTYLLASLVFFAPYILKGRWTVIERNWDGPAYVVIAKTFYKPELIKKENYIKKYLSSPLMFANKLPLYPITIRMFSFLGYEKAMILIAWIFGLLSLLIFRELLILRKAMRPTLLALVYVFFPPRWFVMQKVGGVEPMMIFFLLTSVFMYFKRQYFFAAIFLALATLTKINGLLIFVSYVLIFLFLKRREIYHIVWFILAPLMILLVFFWFRQTYGDFFAYFRSNTRCYEYVSLFKMPYSVFDASACYVGSIHLEEMFWFYGLVFGTILYSFKKKDWEILAFFIPSFLPMLFLQHNDFTRYGIFLYFLVGVVFEKILVKREMVVIFVLLLPAVYLYARNFINVNIFIP